jgi:long-chain acyl-CoA synthetase
MCYGGSIGFFRGDIQKFLKDDIKLLKPTIFVSVPRLYNKFADGIK